MNKPEVIGKEGLNRLIQILTGMGYQVIGPTVRDEAIVYDSVHSIEDLPAGWTDEQEGGTYRLKKRSDEALFGYTLGPHSWKQFLHPPERRLWQAQKDSLGFDIVPEKLNNIKYAFLGVRSCELHAIAIQDKVFIQSPHTDLHYQSLRQNALFVAVNCGQAGNTCFCVSMQTGPKVEMGYDLVLTEILDDECHTFLISAGSDAGKTILKAVEAKPAGENEVKRAEEIIANTANQMGRTMATENIKELLYENVEHPAWEKIAGRCLSCANCTMVCPTCFCSTVEDVTDITGDHAERWQKWDSCFTMDFSSIHGGAVRNSTQSRYRQWMTHKLASWQDQFDTSGCVGCGRCITWCPVGIDLTREVAVIRESQPDQAGKLSGSGGQNENS
ncbi:MAG: 4Fe-4S dicluster domain-containing protein [Nitrospinae bacterium]|nr:4Fe-4S dicluster domain-containing protein [Nitrospinota bacterium]MBL7021050.1 4Fe-4S dicluster domain-containing protein [Nitrospinaceae bacterium]